MSPRQKRRKLIKWINKKQGRIRMVDFVAIFGRSWKRELRKMDHGKLLSEPSITLGGAIGDGQIPKWPRSFVVKSTIFGG